VAYALEARSAWVTLVFAFACTLGSGYRFLQGAMPFELVEGVRALVALAKLAGTGESLILRSAAGASRRMAASTYFETAAGAASSA